MWGLGGRSFKDTKLAAAASEVQPGMRKVEITAWAVGSSGSTLTIALSCGLQWAKGPPVSQVSVHWGCNGPCVWREPACHSPEPTESIQCFRVSPSSPDQKLPGAHFSPLIPPYPRGGCFPRQEL